MVPAYERLTFCLIGVASPNELIKDRRTTPYNVGSTLELRDFDSGAMTSAAERRARRQPGTRSAPDRARALLDRRATLLDAPALRLASGNRRAGSGRSGPARRRAFRSLERVSDDVHFQQVLRFLEPGSLTASRPSASTKGSSKARASATRRRLAHTELKLSGLVKRDEEGCLVVRNRIYERLFDRRWVESTRPRRASAYRRYAVAAGYCPPDGGYGCRWSGSLSCKCSLNGATGIAAGAWRHDQTKPPQKRCEGTQITLPPDASQALLEEGHPALATSGIGGTALRDDPAVEVGWAGGRAGPFLGPRSSTLLLSPTSPSSGRN